MKLKEILRWFLVLPVVTAALGLLSLSLLGFVPEPNYYVDNASQLRLLYLLALVPVLLLALSLRSRLAVWLTVTGIVLNVFICGLLTPPAVRAMPGSRLKIVAANVWGARNRNFDAFVRFVEREHPDLISVEELTPEWLNELKARLPDYPIEFDEKVWGGTAVFSRVPIEQVVINHKDSPRRYGVRGTLRIGGTNALFIASHPPAPFFPQKPKDKMRWKSRNREFQRLAQDVRSAAMPVIIAGDLNSTAWSWYFRRLLDESGLRDSEAGFGVQPSWSTQMPLPLVPIDHCLFTSQFEALDRRLGPNIGSDHLPLVVEVALRR